MKARITFCLVGLVLVANVAFAQETRTREGQLELITNASLRTSIRLLADSARAMGLPDASIINKGLQGQTFSVDAGAIVTSARLQLRNLRSARVALGANVSSQDLQAGADALQVGIEPDAIRRLAAQRGSSNIFATLGVAADLVGKGVPVAVAERAVATLTVAGAADLDLTNFRQGVFSDIARGDLPTAAVTTRVSAATTTDASGITTLINGPATRAQGTRTRIPPEN